MLRIAIISDVHANFPALEETLKSIDEKEIDAVYCLGDLVGYNIWPNAVINEIRKRKIPTICGNHDEKAVAIHQDGRFLKDDDNFAYNIIGKPQVQYLATLPAFIRLEFIFDGKPFTLMLVHGSPYSNKEYLPKEKLESELAAIFLDKGIDMLLFGHTHIPYYRIIGSNSSDRKFHAVNAGSVGKPKDGDKRACYTIITLKNNSKSTVDVEFVRVAYDVEKAAQAIENSPMSPSYALMLRKAY